MSLTSLLFIGGGFLGLIYGAELLVRGAARLSLAWGLTPMVVGLTVVAFGTSAPELAVSLMAVFQDQAGLSIGNIVGSNNFNALVVLGLSALIVPLLVQAKSLRFEIPFLLGSVVLAYVMCLDLVVTTWEGVILVSLLVIFTLVLIKTGRTENSEVKEEYAESLDIDPVHPTEPPSVPWNAALVAAGLTLLVVGSQFLVEGATTVALAFGVSDFIIGVTVVALGTSLPEAAASMLAAAKGERDIAVGNIIGSNLFNILLVLGGTAFIKPGGVAISAAAVALDIPLMVGVTLFLLPVVYSQFRITRLEGFILFSYYVGYLLILIGRETEALWFENFFTAFVYAYVPITVLIPVVGSIRTFFGYDKAAPID